MRRLTKTNIEFLGFVEPGVLAKLYSEAIAYIHPQEEDFGLTAVEAMASGRPVIAFNIGGARETVVNGRTGYYIDEQSWEALGDAVIRFHPENYSPRDCRQQAEKFSADTFRVKMRTFIDEAVKSKSDHHASGI